MAKKQFYGELIITLAIFNSLCFAQRTTLDWKKHNVGAVSQVVTNMGTSWGTFIMNYPDLLYCEYPLNSNEEHIGEGGLWVGALMNDDTLISATTIWASPHHEFYPGATLADSIWVVHKGDTVDIPFWPNYVGVSDQDFVCKYTDYYEPSLKLSDHSPLYLDVIQTSFAWSSPPLDEIIVYTFYITPTRYNLKDVYLAYWLDANVGDRSPAGYAFGMDDASLYHKDKHLGVSYDLPGGSDGTAISPIGIQLVPPEQMTLANTTWSWIYYGQNQSPEDRDWKLYEDLSSGSILEDQQPSGGESHTTFRISVGAVDLNVGDTLKLIAGQLLGKGMKGVLKNSDILQWLVQQNFQVPSPPPPPPLRIETQSHRVLLNWQAQPGDVNPETYKDPKRADKIPQPFEGYRIYKSTRSLTGPWTLLAEYDIADNEFSWNTGLRHEYADMGLLNNFDYFYSVTAYSKPDTSSGFPSLESSVTVNVRRIVPGPAPPKKLGQVMVVPNPYRGDIAYHQFDPPWEPVPKARRWMEQDRRIQFTHLTALCEIRIYSLAGDLVQTLQHNNAQLGYEDWNLTSSVGQAVASGIYIFTVEDLNSGEIQTGKFVIIK